MNSKTCSICVCAGWGPDEPARRILEDHHVATLEPSELGDQDPVPNFQSVLHAAARNAEHLGDESPQQSGNQERANENESKSPPPR